MVDIPARQIPIYLFECLAAATGLVVWWQWQFGAANRLRRSTRLQFWDISTPAFLLLCILVIAGGIIAGALVQATLTFLPKSGQPDVEFGFMLMNLGIQLGVFASVLASRQLTRNQAPEVIEGLTTVPAEPPSPVLSPLSTKEAVLAGALTFLAALPAVLVVSVTWQYVLEACGITVEKQDLLDLFGKTHEPLKLAVMITMATVLAPLTEELVFRAGFFRFLRGRLPRFWAYFIPAIVFASLHRSVSVFAPLLTLGLLFSLVYQRTGRVLVTMIAHALFNLNTVLIVLAGVNM